MKLQNSLMFVITDLVKDSNVQYLDISDDDCEGELYQADHLPVEMHLYLTL